MNGFHDGAVKNGNDFSEAKNGQNGFQNGEVKINNSFIKAKNNQIAENEKVMECCSGQLKYHTEASPTVGIFIWWTILLNFLNF